MKKLMKKLFGKKLEESTKDMSYVCSRVEEYCREEFPHYSN